MRGCDADGLAATHTERIAVARRLRSEHRLTIRAIAVQMGLGATTVAGYLNDPSGAALKQRKLRLRSSCSVCGGATSGRASGTIVSRCRRCASIRRARWSKPLIESAVRCWLARYGSLPSSYDLSATHSRRRGGQALARWNAGFRDGMPWPSASILTGRYGRYRAGIAAAVEGSQVDTGESETRPGH